MSNNQGTQCILSYGYNIEKIYSFNSIINNKLPLLLIPDYTRIYIHTFTHTNNILFKRIAGMSQAFL